MFFFERGRHREGRRDNFVSSVKQIVTLTIHQELEDVVAVCVWMNGRKGPM